MGSTVTQRDWIADVRNAGVVAVANATGIMHPVRDDRPGSGWTPCPACTDNTRHRKRGDKRGAVGLTRDGQGWRCFQCDASGDAVTLACYAAGQGAKLTRDNHKAVYELCERAGLIGPALSSNPRRTPSPVAAPVPSEPDYPPDNEVYHLYQYEARGLAEAADTEANTWLMSRKLDPAVIAATDRVHVLPKSASAPSWAMIGGKPWPATPYRLLAELWNAEGSLCSVHARAVTTAEPKSANPKGHTLAGLVLCCPCAQGMLYGRTADIERVRQHGLVICEGLPDWLTKIARNHGNPEAPAVLGIVSGSWTQAHADKVPDGCRVLIATDRDKDGDRYAAKIAETLARRMRAGTLDVRRWKPKE